MRQARVPGRQLLRPIAVRTLLLFALGVICNGGLAEPWPDVRIAGVLQRLSICYAVGCLVAWHLSWRQQCALLAAILLGYWAAMEWVPFPGATADRYGGLANLAVHVDRAYLPGQGLYGTWDPEGILPTLPAIGTCVAGIVLGRLFSMPIAPKRRLLVLLAIGIGAMALGKAWGAWFPINKYMWTSSFVLATAGAISMHLCALYLLYDVWGYRKIFTPLLVYGRNSLTAYVGSELLDFEALALTIAGGSVALFFGRWSGLALAAVVISIQWSLLAWLDKRRVRAQLTSAPRPDAPLDHGAQAAVQ